MVFFLLDWETEKSWTCIGTFQYKKLMKDVLNVSYANKETNKET